MPEFTSWRLLREELEARGYLKTDLTDEPMDPETAAAANNFMEEAAGEDVPYDKWDDSRTAIAALQLIALQAGAYDGDIDGLAGPLTRHALEVMEYRLANAGAIDQIPEEVSLKNPETFRTVMDAKARAKEPASIRYCNPGAMYPGPSATKFGSTRHEVIGGGHLIAVFPDDLSGAAAQFDLLYNKYTGLTIRAAIRKWCGDNSANAYAQRVSKETGLDPDEVLTKDMVLDPKVAIPFCRAAAQVEAGKPYPLDDTGWLAAHDRFMETNGQVGVPAKQSDGDIPEPTAAPVPKKQAAKAAVVSNRWPLQRDVPSFFGEVGSSQVKMPLPYPMRIAWDLKKTVTSMSVHAKVADSARRVLENVLQEYGQEEITRLRLDLWGGSFNPRRMTGGSGWSMHAWGIAIDFDPDNNGFSTHKDKAEFARPEYVKWWELWEAEGWVSLGRARDFDWMHVQAARLG